MIFSARFSAGGVTVLSLSACSWRMVSALVSWAIAWPGWTSHTVAAASSAAARSFARPVADRGKDSRRSPSISSSPGP